MRIPNITQSIDNLAWCIFYLKSDRLSWERQKEFVLDYFQKYRGIRKTYNHEVIQIEEKLVSLEGDFEDIISTSEILSNEQITQLYGIIIKIQHLIFNEIDPKYHQELKERYPQNFIIS